MRRTVESFQGNCQLFHFESLYEKIFICMSLFLKTKKRGTSVNKSFIIKTSLSTSVNHLSLLDLCRIIKRKY